MSRAQQFLNPFFSGQPYTKKLLSYGPIAYWPQDEATGTTVNCLVNAAQDGTYTGVTLANAAGPDGVRKAPLYDGTNDFADVQTATLAAAFSGAAGTIAAWAKVNAAGIWTDGSWNYIARLAVDNNNEIKLIKTNTNNRLEFTYNAGATSKTVYKDSMTETGWMHLALTWDKTADQVKAYYNGSQEGTTQTTLGTWAGSLSNARIGAYNATLFRWHGWLADVALWTSALDADTIAALATP